MRRPDFFIVGAPKCGTTALHTYLREHPQIFMPKFKDPHFFAVDLESPAYIQEESRYLSLFADATHETRVGESSVWYLYSKEAASQIHEFNPESQIIVMLRNPIDVLYSQHRQFLWNGNEDIEDFEEALAAEEERKRGKRIPKDPLLVEGLYYRETVKFSEQVKRYLDIFGKERVFIIIFDDFSADTARVYRDVLKFLGVNQSYQPKDGFPVINPNKRVRSMVLWRTLRNPPRILLLLGKLFAPVKPVRRALIDSIRKWTVVRQPRKPMPIELRRRLQAEFASEIESLSDQIGRDLTGWISD